jgi:hypothetical protein
VTPPERLKETLRRLAEDVSLRESAGAAGRRYVEAQHGYEPVARMWEQVYAAVWHGVPLPSPYWRATEAATGAEQPRHVIRGTA